MEYSGIEWNASAGYVPAALPLPCLTSVKLWISSGWAMRGRIQRRAAFLASFEAANACKKTAGIFVPCCTASYEETLRKALRYKCAYYSLADLS